MAYVHLPPPKRLRHSATPVKSFANYTPAQKHVPPLDTDALLSYPLTLHSRAVIQIYRNRESAPLKAPCRHCSKPTTLSLAQQKLFLTVERLLQKSMDKVSDTERNQANTWAVNYEIGIYEPFVEQNSGFKSKNVLGSRCYPFADGFELDVVMKLLQKIGEGLCERSLNMYLQIMKGMDEAIRTIRLEPVAVPQHPSWTSLPTLETPKKPKSYQHQQYIPITPPGSSPLRHSQHSCLQSSPPVPSSSLSSLAHPIACQLPPLYRPPNPPSQLPSLNRTLDKKSPLRSFSDMKELFEIFDKIERGSYAAARLMEAYADAIVNEACSDCWAKHNIIEDDGGEEAGFVDPLPFPPVIQEQHVGLIHLSQDMQRSITPYTGIPVMRHNELLGPPGGIRLNSPPPFAELEGNVGSSIKRAREIEEDELERRWRERARKREAAGVMSQSGKGERESRGPIGRPKKWGDVVNQEVIIID